MGLISSASILEFINPVKPTVDDASGYWLWRVIMEKETLSILFMYPDQC